MSDPILRYPDVITEVGVSRSTIERQIRCGTFPRPRRLGKRAVGWPASQIAAWKQNRPLTEP